MPFDVDAAKAKLQAILAAARLRREWIERGEVHAPVVSSPVVADVPAVASTAPVEQPQPAAATPAPAPEPTPDTHPELFIEVRTPELIRLRGIEGFNNDVGREVLSGKMIITYRRRLPTDGDAVFVLVPPKSRTKPDEEKIEWPSWGEFLPMDPRLKKYDPLPRGWSLRRNSGCLRADGSIEP
jgi:hypothetical protein